MASMNEVSTAVSRITVTDAVELLRRPVFACGLGNSDVLFRSTPLAVTLDLTLMGTSSSSTGMALLSSAGPPLAHCPSSALAFLAMPLHTESSIELTSEPKRSPSSGARAAKHPSRSECAGVRDPKWLINHAEAFIDAGGHSEGIPYREPDNADAVPVKPTPRRSGRHVHIVIASAITYAALQVPADCATSSVSLHSTTPEPECGIPPSYFHSLFIGKVASATGSTRERKPGPITVSRAGAHGADARLGFLHDPGKAYFRYTH
ncbi:uncharacterized protein TRAVEDRAFT_51992 [Trametes versicolor FP-101664 SS1]|uniref:uncharacterized protein n=1 Tax=Trametes versicolor (strain FP-101664) TaxID=717944 RepID=UPI0004622233|nr:uncharacterized protein TRAVEDRAFT_51992 [Trametes versicolor FP-101664 SS1]EIW54281.1 hypothetical protein TRAVEDRAFT_51992 [Trametes versicolor FP-101664 SS1]